MELYAESFVIVIPAKIVGYVPKVEPGMIIQGSGYTRRLKEMTICSVGFGTHCFYLFVEGMVIILVS